MIEQVVFDRDAPALVEELGARVVTYRELGRRVARLREELVKLPRPALVFQFAANSTAWIVSYLACLAERLPLGLGEQGAARDRVISVYMPSAILLDAGEAPPGGYELRVTASEGLSLFVRTGSVSFAGEIHPDTALLLPTSGSTGDAKFVRLTLGNLSANARSIATYLGLNPNERAVQSLPLHYSYGLSLLNSHLLVGGSVLLTKHSFLRPEFWREVEVARCTSFAGVPYMYETLQRLRISPAERGSLRTLTQAGGHLRPEVVHHFHAASAKIGARFFVMYGQTEATARIAYVPPERLAEKLGTIGIAIPGGELALQPVDGEGEHQQLVYRGPNVMMGYASGPADLARGDEMHGVLPTGDLASVDSDGYFRLIGRLARFAKLFGKRINLASVESEVEARHMIRAMAIDGGDKLKVFLETSAPNALTEVRAHVSAWLGVPPVAVQVHALAQLPMTANGKKDYKALK